MEKSICYLEERRREQIRFLQSKVQGDHINLKRGKKNKVKVDFNAKGKTKAYYNLIFFKCTVVKDECLQNLEAFFCQELQAAETCI